MPNHNITYRVANASDIPGMSLLRAEQYGESTAHHWQSRIEGYQRGEVNPQQALPPRIIYVADKDEKVIGFIAGHLTGRFECDGEVQWINVASDHQRTGIAFQLLQQLATWFVNQKAPYVCVNCAADNTPAQKFYRRHGAQPLNEHWLIWNDIGILL